MNLCCKSMFWSSDILKTTGLNGPKHSSNRGVSWFQIKENARYGINDPRLYFSLEQIKSFSLETTFSPYIYYPKVASRPKVLIHSRGKSGSQSLDLNSLENSLGVVKPAVFEQSKKCRGIIE